MFDLKCMLAFVVGLCFGLGGQCICLASVASLCFSLSGQCMLAFVVGLYFGLEWPMYNMFGLGSQSVFRPRWPVSVSTSVAGLCFDFGGRSVSA